jgi:transcriptional regulator with GAF, ATPase, and Fis domain
METKHTKETLEESLRFQELVSKISTKFIGLSGIEFEQAIQDALAEIGRYFNSDTVRLYRLSLLGDVLKIRNMWRDENLSPPEEMPKIHKMKYPNLANHYSKGESLVFSNYEESPEWPEMRKILKFFGTKAGVGVPLEVDGLGVDVYAMDKVQSEHVWPKNIVEQSKSIGNVILSAMRRREAEIQLQEHFDEIKFLKDQLETDNIYLRDEINLNHNFEEIIGESRSLKYALHSVEKIAPVNTTVLLLGETGTGKELFARAIHNASPLKNRPVIKLNCATLPPDIIESELFGHEKGAFTGAHARQIGRFERADGTTIFLDEIGELPLALQPKLLRVLQDGEFERLGGSKTLKTNVRVIAATNRNLEEEVLTGRFRSDLYYRLKVFPITIPPLRKRIEDLPLLVKFLVKRISRKLGKEITEIPNKAIEVLQNYSWPGNVRELENVIEGAVINSSGKVLRIELPKARVLEEYEAKTLEDVERDHITKTLKLSNWRIEGSKGAAVVLGMNPGTLRSRMQKLGIEKPK